MSLEQVISRVKRLAADKLASHVNADEFIEIGDADGFKIYVTAGKTIDNSPHPLHENPRDAFMMLLEGEIEFIFENGERETVKSGVSFVLPKHLKHQCIFRRLTIAVEGVYEKGL
jgi:mannose-6-phosphate isomerase-like protein (cupin superfamily)